MAKILVTGANGFVGSATCATLASRGHQVVAAVRNAAGAVAGLPTVAVGTVGAGTDWMPALAGCATVVHLAARAHVLRETTADPMADFRATNVAGTLQLARCAIRAGAQRFVYISSVGVNGQQCTRPFTEADTPAPVENYARSKLEAELALKALTWDSGMQLVIVRPPLVYGPGCPGNFLRLLKLLATGVPLPFGRIENSRSFVGIWNLADFLATCAEHQRAAGETFLVSDMEDVSLPNLLRHLATGMGRRARLLPVNPAWLAGLARMAGQADLHEKLCGSLTVDPSHIRRVLDWSPPVGLAEGLRRTGLWYVQKKAGLVQ